MSRRTLVGFVLIVVTGTGSALAANRAAFIKFDGLTADSEAGIEAVSFDIDDHAIETCADAARATEQIRVHQVTFTKSIDKASPKLAESATAGRGFAKVKVEIHEQGGGRCGLTFEYVEALRVGKSNSLEEVSFGFKKVVFEAIRRQ